MTSGTLYRVMTQNVTLRDIDTIRMKHHVHAVSSASANSVSVYDGKADSRDCIVVEKQAK